MKPKQLIITQLSNDHLEELKVFFTDIIERTFIEEGIPNSIETPIQEITHKLNFLNEVLNGKNPSTVYLATINQKIVGTIAYGNANGDILSLTNNELSHVIEIGSIYVDYNYQGLGIAKELIHFVLEELHKKTIHTFCLDSGYKHAQAVWLHLLGKPYLVSKNHWSNDTSHMIWLCDVETVLKSFNRKNYKKKNTMDLLISRIKKMEEAYIEAFTTFKHMNNTIIYKDESLPNMYTHNFTLYQTNNNLVQSINNVLQAKNSNFYRIETYEQLSEDELSQIVTKPEITTYEIYHLPLEGYTYLEKYRCKIVLADNEKVLNDGLMVDIEANKEGMGEAFAKTRALRKQSIYKQKAVVQLFVCYLDGLPIGKVEFATNQDMVKIEEFEILPQYQRKGYGKEVLFQLFTYAKSLGLNDIYLNADQGETAKELYKKIGMHKVLEKYEYFFLIT